MIEVLKYDGDGDISNGSYLGKAFNLTKEQEDEIIAQANGESLSPNLSLLDEVRAKEREEWISLEDRLPELYELVLVYQNMTGICLRLLQGDQNETDWYDENNNYDDSGLEITHWMPLPASPIDAEIKVSDYDHS